MKLNKVLSIIVLTFMLLTIATNFAYAAAEDAISFDPGGYKGIKSSGISDIETLGQKVIGTVQVVGSLLSVAVLVVLGIKYMMGSTEEKAEYKKTLIPYVVGAIIVFAASNIAGIVYKVASEV